MNKYETYKSTGLDWIGKIPEQWETIRVKGNCYVKGRIGWQELKADEFIDEGIHCVTGTDFQRQFVNWQSCYRVSLERYLIDDNIQLKEGDVLITKDGTIGKTALVKNLPEKATLNSGIFLVRPEKKKLTNEYLYWILNSTVFEDFNNYTKTGATILHLYQNVFVEMHFPLPTEIEQLSIAKYLDHQTQKIDCLIANKKAQADKLKELRQIEINNAVTKGLNPNAELKDSGIDWLGEIPKHWAVKRLKNVSNFIQTGITPPSEKSEYYDGDIPWYGPGGFNGDTILSNPAKYITQKAIEDNEAKLFPIDCIFMIGIGATIGKVGIIKEPSSCNQQLNIVNFKSYVSPDFGVYLLKTYENIIIKIANFSTLPIYNQVQTGNLKFLLPPKEEQLQIAKYLQERTAAIDKLIINIDAQIEKLQELRKIKIYEAVTGKIKVNAYVEATA